MKKLILYLTVLIITVSVSFGANGDNLRHITAANPSQCSINVGLAFDGTNLLITCYYNNKIDFVSPADGSLVKTVTVTGKTSLGAAAWDESRHKIWVCSDFSKVILVDPSDGSSTDMFTSSGCFDGLAYDGADDTIWASPDANPMVSHYKTDGTPLSTTNSGISNSGIAVGGEKLYLANNGGQQIYEASKDFSSMTLFASFPRRLEDMECDDLTFVSSGVGAIWSQDAYDRELNAYEIPAGKCGFGGSPPKEPICGDGIVNQESEQCDDGNTENGDGCSSTCQREEQNQVPEFTTIGAGLVLAGAGAYMYRRRNRK